MNRQDAKAAKKGKTIIEPQGRREKLFGMNHRDGKKAEADLNRQDAKHAKKINIRTA